MEIHFKDKHLRELCEKQAAAARKLGDAATRKPQQARALTQLPKTKAAVVEFAGAIGVHPGIVVGRMQHDRLMDVSWMNDIKVSFTLKAATPGHRT